MDYGRFRKVLMQQPTVEQGSDIICNSGTHLSLGGGSHRLTFLILKED
ncbi:MAG: hypothetical protein NWE79_07245 [Candidatus Bathyarchaeota archaeon]|nr:hypothetical protein [Candidatus Bathyarchaeota archaeon]